MRTYQFFGSWCTRARNATCSTPSRTPTPNCLASRLTSSRGRHCRIVPAARRRLHVIPTHKGRHFSPKAVRLDCRKSYQNSGGKAPESSIIRLQKASMPAPNFSRPKLVLMMDCRCEKRRPSPPAPDSAFRELITSRAVWGSNSLSGRHFGPLPSSESKAFAAMAAAAASEIEKWSSSGNFAFTRSHVASFLGTLGSARGLRAATATHPGWRHADDALLTFASSVASRAESLRLADVRRAYPISHGSKRVISPRSTDANLSRRFTRPSCECSKAGRMLPQFNGSRSEFGASTSLLSRCSPKVWFKRPST